MSDIVASIRSLLSMSWHFLMNTYIPNTHIAYGVMLVGLTIMGFGFKFLSVAIGHNIGEAGALPDVRYGSPKSTSLVVSDKRKNDVR